MIFKRNVPGVAFYVLFCFSYHKHAISATRFFAVFDHFRIYKIYCSSTYNRGLH